jgi:heme A synthase
MGFKGFLEAVHHNLVLLIWLCGGAATIWGAFLLVRRRAVDRALRVLLGVTVGVGITQGVVGGLLFLMGDRPPGGSLSFLHFVYGAIVIAAIPVAYTYADNKSVRRDMLIYTVGALVVVAAAVRAFMTGVGMP